MNIWTINLSLPEKAGKAVILYENRPTSYYDGGDIEPKRINGLIKVPLCSDGQLFPLLKGKQFLIRRPGRWLYFGGTDEEPFLVKLDPNVFNCYQSGGEQGFFNALVPDGVLQICKSGKKFKRQGDIFAAPICFSWKQFRQIYSLFLGGDFKSAEIKEGNLFETRHLFTGLAANSSFPAIGTNALFGEGVIKAPDHADLIIEGIHFFAQTKYLFNPKLAD